MNLRDLEKTVGEDPRQAAIELDRLMDALLAAPPENENLFDRLEQLGQPVAVVARELARRYQNKPLPLGDGEDRLFRQVVSLWTQIAKAYAKCASRQAAADGDPERVRRMAASLQRSILHTGNAIFEHYQTRRGLPAGLWRDLHGCYACAEDAGVDTLAIADGPGRSTHCAAAYIAVLLCEMARPYSLAPRDLTLVRGWATEWAPLVTLHRPLPGESLPPFVVDLTHDAAFRPSTERLQDSRLRRLDTDRLARQLRDRIGEMAASASSKPENAGMRQTRRMLDHLSGPWSQTLAQRKFARQPASGAAGLCTGFEDIHCCLSGKAFAQPRNSGIYDQIASVRLCAPREAVPAGDAQWQEATGPHPCNSDTWEVVNHSANGFRIARGAAGGRVQLGQLLGLRPPDGDRFLLAKIAWLVQEAEGGLTAGVMVLPGMPTAVGARPVDRDGQSDGPFHPAFLLQPLSPGDRQCLILPPGWYLNGGFVDLSSGQAGRVRMDVLIEESRDFQRIAILT